MAGKAPPRYVPTLTEVVKGAAAPVPDAVLVGEQLVQRVLQRVDQGLERKLREAIAATVIEHTRDIAPALRERIEAVVRDAVAQALAEEQPRTARGRK